MDIDTAYGYDANKSVWLTLGDDAQILVRHFDANAVSTQAVRTRVLKPVRKLIEQKLLSPEKDRECTIQVFVECSVLDWRGVTVKGKELPFSKEAAVKLFTDYSKLFIDVFQDAQELGLFKADEETAKN